MSESFEESIKGYEGSTFKPPKLPVTSLNPNGVSTAMGTLEIQYKEDMELTDPFEYLYEEEK